MTKRGLLTIIFVLLITNIVTLVLLSKKDKLDESSDNINEVDNNISQEKVTSLDDVVASFQGEDISYRDWMRSLRGEYGKEHLEEMMLKKVVSTLAKEEDLQVNEKVIEREISFLTSMSGLISDEELAELQKTWREDLIFQHQLEALLTEAVDISDAEAQEHYNHYQNQYDFSATFQLSHIVVDDMDVAEKIIRELEEGAQFSLLAQEYSIDEDTKDAGGYLGFFTKGSQFVPYGYRDIVADLEEGSYSDPVSLGNEIVIVFLHRNLPEITFSFEEIKDDIKRELAIKQIDKQKEIKELWEEQNIDWIFGDEHGE